LEAATLPGELIAARTSPCEQACTARAEGAERHIMLLFEKQLHKNEQPCCLSKQERPAAAVWTFASRAILAASYLRRFCLLFMLLG
jgi:hypothetical protein